MNKLQLHTCDCPHEAQRFHSQSFLWLVQKENSGRKHFCAFVCTCVRFCEDTSEQLLFAVESNEVEQIMYLTLQRYKTHWNSSLCEYVCVCLCAGRPLLAIKYGCLIGWKQGSGNDHSLSTHVLTLSTSPHTHPHTHNF